MCFSSACDPLWLIHVGGVSSSWSASGNWGGFTTQSYHKDRPRPVWDRWESCEFDFLLNKYLTQTGVVMMLVYVCWQGGSLWPPVLCLNCVLFDLQLLLKNLQFEDGKMIPASKYFSSGESSSVELTDEETKMAEEIRASQQQCSLVSHRQHQTCHD